jgi:hypothetical protein
MLGLYDRDELLVHRTTLDETPALFEVATVFTLGAWIAQESFDQNALSAAQIAFLWPVLVVCLLLTRTTTRRIARRMTEPERCLVIGNVASAESLRRSFGRGSAVSAEVVGRLPIRARTFRD